MQCVKISEEQRHHTEEGTRENVGESKRTGDFSRKLINILFEDTATNTFLGIPHSFKKPTNHEKVNELRKKNGKLHIVNKGHEGTFKFRSTGVSYMMHHYARE